MKTVKQRLSDSLRRLVSVGRIINQYVRTPRKALFTYKNIPSWEKFIHKIANTHELLQIHGCGIKLIQCTIKTRIKSFLSSLSAMCSRLKIRESCRLVCQSLSFSTSLLTSPSNVFSLCSLQKQYMINSPHKMYLGRNECRGNGLGQKAYSQDQKNEFKGNHTGW